MNYKYRELLEFRISIKSYENMNKVGPTHLFQIASLCFLAFPTFSNASSVRESDLTAQMIWWYCAAAHLRGNIGLVLALLVVIQNFLQYQTKPSRTDAQPGGGHLPLPKFSKHSTEILTCAETFK